MLKFCSGEFRIVNKYKIHAVEEYTLTVWVGENGSPHTNQYIYFIFLLRLTMYGIIKYAVVKKKIALDDKCFMYATLKWQNKRWADETHTHTRNQKQIMCVRSQ